MKTNISTLKENAKRFGVNLTHVVNGKRVAKTRSRLSKDVRKKDKAEWKKLVKRLRKFQDKLEPVIARATNYTNTWLNNEEDPRQLKSKLITKGIELWQDIVSYYNKRGTRMETYTGLGRRGKRAPGRVPINRIWGNFNTNGVNLNARSALGGFFQDLNGMGPRDFRGEYQKRNTTPKKEAPPPRRSTRSTRGKPPRTEAELRKLIANKKK